MEHTLWNLLHEMVMGNEARIALRYRTADEVVDIRYDELLREIKAAVRHAETLPERRVGIWGKSTYAWIIAAYACMLTGKHVVLFDPAVGREDFARLADYTDIEAFVADGELVDEARKIFPDRAVYTFEELQGEGSAAPSAAGGAQEPPNAPEQDLIIFTSGTSASAKGVVIPLVTLTEHLRLFRNALPGNPEEVYFSPIPFFHIFGFLMVIEVLNRSGIFCISSGARALKDDLWAYRARNITIVPSMIGFVLESCGFPPETHVVITGGSACPRKYQDQLRESGIDLYAMYGMSEVLGFIGISDADGELTRYRVADGIHPGLSPEGELELTLPCHFKEYYKKETETHEVLRGDTVLTGDLVELDAEGYVRILGRTGDVIVLRNGEKIHVADMDAELSALPGVREVAVFGCDGFPVLAYTPGDGFDEEGFQAALNGYNRGRPLDRKLTRTWNYGAPLPRTSIGKIKRSRLAAEYRRLRSAQEDETAK